MLKRLLVGMAVAGCLVLVVDQAHSETITAEKIKAYAQAYPDLFQQPIQNVSYNGGGNAAAVLLVDSFDGDDNMHALSAALEPGQRSAMKTDSSIRRVMASKNIQWQEYQTITEALARDPRHFQVFLSHLDEAKVKTQLLPMVESDPMFMHDLGSLDHQAIMQNVVSAVKNESM